MNPIPTAAAAFAGDDDGDLTLVSHINLYAHLSLKPATACHILLSNISLLVSPAFQVRLAAECGGETNVLSMIRLSLWPRHYLLFSCNNVLVPPKDAEKVSIPEELNLLNLDQTCANATTPYCRQYGSVLESKEGFMCPQRD